MAKNVYEQTEEWTEVMGFVSYEISTCGNIRRKLADGYRYNQPSLNKQRGYLYASTVDQAARKNWAIHRLVAESFLPRVEGKNYVNHIDGNKLNNRLDNLEWCTHQENIDHARANGLITDAKVRRWKMSKLTLQQVVGIKHLRGSLSYHQIARLYNTNYSNVAHIMRGSRWGDV